MLSEKIALNSKKNNVRKTLRATCTGIYIHRNFTLCVENKNMKQQNLLVFD